MPFFDARQPPPLEYLYGLRRLPGTTEYFHTITSNEIDHINMLRGAVTEYMPDKLSRIDKALNRALSAHAGQKRDTGEPYSEHLLVSAIWAAQLKLSDDNIIAQLLHDTDEDTKYKLKDIERDFGPKVKELVNGVTEVRHGQTHDNPAHKLLDAVVKSPGSVLIRGGDQEHNSETAYVKSPKKIERAYEVATEFTAPLLIAFGLPDQARRLINHTAEARYGYETKKIREFVSIHKPYDYENLVGPMEKIMSTLYPTVTAGQEYDFSSIDFNYPTLQDLMDSTMHGQNITMENMLLHFDIGFTGEEQALSYLLKLYDFDKPSIKAEGKNFTLKSDSDLLKEFKIRGRLDFYQNIDGRLVHFRLIPKKQYDFERTSLVPLFQENPDVSEEKMQAAREKLSRYQEAWQHWKSNQAKNFTVTEFVRFLRGEGSIKVHTPPTKTYREGQDFQMPAGACAYDLIARLPLPKKAIRNMLLRVKNVKITKGTLPFYQSPMQPLQTGALIEIITGKEITLTPDVLYQVKTDESLGKIRKLIREMMDVDPELVKQIRQRGRNRIKEIFCQRTGAENLDIREEVGIAGAATRYSNHYEVKEKTGRAYYRGLVEAFHEEMGLRATPDTIIETVVNAMVSYRNSLIPITITTVNDVGLDMYVNSLFRDRRINIERKSITFPTGGHATITIFIDPSHRAIQEDLQKELDYLKNQWEKQHKD